MIRFRISTACMMLGLVGFVVVGGQTDSPIRWQGSKGWEPESAYCRLYDAQTVTTLNGTILRIEKVIPMQGMGDGIHLMLKTSKETIPVQLGPTWYVEKLDVHLQAGDVVEVTGSRVPCDGKPVILAATVKKGNEIAIFREIKGSPAWAGMKH